VAREPLAESSQHHDRLRPSAWQLTLTTAGMVAVVNSVVIGACAGLAVAALPIRSLVIALAAGAIAGLAALSIQRRHHRQASDTYRQELIDRAAILIPAIEQGEP
jgi:ribose/xylose/arabinose/galactoside ABC-type transport system permease subunit